MKVRDLMTPNPIQIAPETAVAEIARILIEHRINGVPVVDGAGRLIGVVTAEDLIHRGADERLEPRESIWKENFWVSFLGPKGTQRDKAEGRTAAEVMTTEVHSVAPAMHSSVAARLMVDHHLTSLPVVEDGKVIGVISRIDLLSLLKELENPLEREN